MNNKFIYITIGFLISNLVVNYINTNKAKKEELEQQKRFCESMNNFCNGVQSSIQESTEKKIQETIHTQKSIEQLLDELDGGQ